MTIRTLATTWALSAALALPLVGCKAREDGSRLRDAEAVGEAPAAPPCRVLVAMSDAAILVAPSNVPLKHTTKEFTFGFLLDEMTIPVMALLDAGCQVSFANPTGVEPPRDPEGDAALYFTDGLPAPAPGTPLLTAALAKLRLDALVPGPAEKEELAKSLKLVTSVASPIRGTGSGAFDTPLKFKDLNDDALGAYDAIFVPGGYAPMLNLWKDEELGRILRWFHAQQKTTVTLCRGGVALRSALYNGNDWAYAGYKMTTYSTLEDDVASLTGHVLPLWKLPFHPNEKLKELGGLVEFAPFRSHVVEDRELLTGENQWSAHELAKRFVAKLGR